MRRVWKISEAAQRADLLLHITKPKTLKPLLLSPTSPRPLNPFKLLLLRAFSTAQHSSSSSSPWPITFDCLTSLFDKSRAYDPKFRKELRLKVVELKDELIKVNGDYEGVCGVLDQMGLPLFASNLDGSALIMLLEELRALPQLAIEVFDWRRKKSTLNLPITSEEYSKGIAAAGNAKNINLAVELFTEAVNNRAKAPAVYNALMAVYMSNSMPAQCQSLFWQFKKDRSCSPTTVTYNILISVFGRLMLIDHMEATLEQIYESNLSPNTRTFNNLIAGYITAWMWDRMEHTYSRMKESSIEPDTYTHSLLLRGYANGGKLEKMEEVYELVKQDVDGNNAQLIRCMIYAYCKNPCLNRIKKIEKLLALVPEEEYSSWLNVLLIRFYAQEQLLEKMEKFINFAFEHKTTVRNSSVMRSIITAYYRLNVVDKLADFVKHAECAGWRLCRSLYHCKMVMYGSQNRLEEMESVLSEMQKIKMRPTKKTMIILYKAYSNWGRRHKREQVAGLMCKHGYGILLDDCPS